MQRTANLLQSEFLICPDYFLKEPRSPGLPAEWARVLERQLAAATGEKNGANVIMVGAMLVLLFEGAHMLNIGDTWKSEGAHNKDHNRPHISARL